MQNYPARAAASKAEIEIKNGVLRNTYLLLSMTLIFSAGIAYLSMVYNLPSPNLLIFFVGAYGLMFLTHALQNSALGLIAVFMFTGFMGYTLGPMLNGVMSIHNGDSIISLAFFSTGIIFLGLSGHVLMTKKDYSYLGGLVFIGFLTAILSSFAAVLFNIPALHLAVSAAFVLLSSASILYQTSKLVNGGERNYILATIGLYVSIYNLFVSLLHIYSSFSGNRN